MPNLYIHTNLKNDDIPLDFEEKLIKKVASVMSVPTEVSALIIKSQKKCPFKIEHHWRDIYCRKRMWCSKIGSINIFSTTATIPILGKC